MSWERAGEIGVDAGICWIGDPCYILHKDEPPKDIGKNWSGFCNRIQDQDVIQFNHDLGHTGLGVVVSTGYGDGCYPVYVKKDSSGRVISARVDFMQDEDEDEDDEDDENSEDCPLD